MFDIKNPSKHTIENLSSKLPLTTGVEVRHENLCCIQSYKYNLGSLY